MRANCVYEKSIVIVLKTLLYDEDIMLKKFRSLFINFGEKCILEERPE